MRRWDTSPSQPSPRETDEVKPWLARRSLPPRSREIRRALDDARAGRASLTHLARAHDLVSGTNATTTLGELREHIRQCTPKPPLRDEGKAIFLGFLSGVLTHVILKRFSERSDQGD